MIKLSIIIPYYNAKKYTDELLDCLERQVNDRVEVILVDDGSPVPFETKYNWVRVFHKINGGCASARNYGLENARGTYVQFIDADDMVPDYFIERLFESFTLNPDVIEYSWRSLSAEGAQHRVVLNSESDRLPNASVCTRCFKRAFIGSNRFNELKDSTEDEDFTRKLGVRESEITYTRTVISDFMYFYRTAVDNSKIKRFKRGLMHTKRIIYHYENVTSDMTWLLEEIKEEDKNNEVWLITRKNDIPELKRYCQIGKPTMKIWGHFLRGEPYSNFIEMKIPIKKQVVMYVEFANVVGGITTFIYNWAYHMKQHYDILILYDKIAERQVEKIASVAPIMMNDLSRDIICDTLILNRLTDKIPPNISYGKSIQMCHACLAEKYPIPQDRDYLVNVSQVAKDTWGEQAKNGIVIHNLSYDDSSELFLVSATRMQANDKGKNDKRFRILAEKLNEAQIPFVWLNFSDRPLPNPPKNFINMDARLNIQSFIKRASYLVQLSDQEAYSMSILEALTLNTPVLACPFPSLFEEGFIDGHTGYVIPFNMDFDVHKLLDVPQFTFYYDDHSIVKQWKQLLDEPSKGMRYGNSQIVKPTETVKSTPPIDDSQRVKVRVLKAFRDKYTGVLIPVGYTSLPKSRVDEILQVQKEKKIKLIELE